MPLINNPDPTLQNNLMAFGREHDSGWNKLANELFEELDKLPEEIHLLQVKEKYGSLHVYVSGASEKAQDTIDWYEELSRHVCERCGEFYTSKERISHGWVKTLCLKCAEKLDYLDE